MPLDTELVHHGVKGQKHGVRRGPPYPLGQEEKAKNREQAKLNRKKEKEKPKNVTEKIRTAAKKMSEKAKARQKIEQKKAAERKAKADKKRAEKTESKKSKREKRAEERLAKAKARNERNRQRILENPSLLYKNRKKFTAEEIENAIKTFERDKRLKSLSVADIRNGKEYVENVVGFGEALVKGYNLAARVYNTVNKGDKDHSLPYVPNIDNSKKKDKKKDKDKDDD